MKMDALAEHHTALRALCAKHHVRALYLFGSATREDFDPQRSDLDFLVEFDPAARGGGFGDVYFKLHEDLEKLFGRKVDLIERQVVERSKNPYRRESILANPVLLYAA